MIMLQQLIKTVTVDSLPRLEAVKSISRTLKLNPAYQFCYIKFYLNCRIFSCCTMQEYLENYCRMLERPVAEHNFVEKDDVFNKGSLVFSPHDPQITIK